MRDIMSKEIWVRADRSDDKEERKETVISALESGVDVALVRAEDSDFAEFGKVTLHVAGKDVELVELRTPEDQDRAMAMAGKADAVVLDEPPVTGMDAGSAIQAMVPGRIHGVRSDAMHVTADSSGAAARNRRRSGTVAQGSGDGTAGSGRAATTRSLGGGGTAALRRSGAGTALGRSGDATVSAAAAGSLGRCGTAARRSSRRTRRRYAAASGRRAGCRRSGRMRGRITAAITLAGLR